jgi:spore germination protein YaaH
MSHRMPSHPHRFRRGQSGGRPSSWRNWRIPLLSCLLLGVTVGLNSPLTNSRGHVIAYVAYWDQGSGFASAERHLDTLSAVSPWWYSVNYAGEVVPQHAGMTDIDANTVGRFTTKGIRIMPTISNHRDGEWDDDVVEEVLADPGRTAKHIRSIVDLVEREGYVGIDIDYENLRSTSRHRFSGFLRDLSASLHRNRKLLSVSVHPKTSDEGLDQRNVAQDYRAIGAAADQVRIMTYDYHWATSGPGPVAPTGWVDDVIAYTLRHVPRDKVMMGIPLFGYDWVHGGAAEPVTWDQVQDRVRAHQVAVTFDHTSEASWFTYVDRDRRRHTVWFDDTAGTAAKLRLARAYGIAGVFLWRLGGESPEMWRLLKVNPP